MPMPEAPVYKNRYTPFGKHDVWPPWKSGRMERKSETSRMKLLANRKFWFSPSGPDAGHHPASGRHIDDVNHVLISARFAQASCEMSC